MPCLAAKPPGAELRLPYRGIRKLFHKDAVIARSASPLFRLAPYVVFGTMVLAAAIIPSMGTRLPFTRGRRASRWWACLPRRACLWRSRPWTLALLSVRSARAAK